MEKRVINHAWLTLNKHCNLKCRWCYLNRDAGTAGEKEIDIQCAYEIIDILDGLNVKNITITGGEPTTAKFLKDILKYINSKNINTLLNTNGVLLSDGCYVKELEQIGLTTLNISQKGCNEKEYHYNTGKFMFGKTLQAIQNISKTSINLIVSFVLTKETIKGILDAVKVCMQYGADSFYFSLDYCCNSIKEQLEIVDNFQDIYYEIDKLTNGNFMFHAVLPLCFLDENIVYTMLNKNQITYGCQLLNEDGVVFDNKANIIACNSLQSVVLGKFGEDYNDLETFCELLNSFRIREFYKKVRSVPHVKCMKCHLYSACMGGCLIQWLSNDFQNLIMEREQYYENRRFFEENKKNRIL